MEPEEQELLGDYRYRNYSSVIEKALRNFESSSEWADLISSLGKLSKALQSNLKYSLLPRRLIISKRLAQCLHPALPSGVHLKALETYEIIFKIVGTKWLAKDLFLYSCGLFPLLAHAAMSVKPTLLGLYEKYFLPLHRSLLPSLQAFVTGLLPGLEEGSDIYDRTDTLLLRLSQVVGKEVFYSALWGSVLVSPAIRLPASLFVVTHINRDLSGREQSHMLGTDFHLTVKSLCTSVLDSNVLVQRNNLEVILFFFPFDTCLDPRQSAVPLSRANLIHVLSAAIQTLLRRDMSLNRRLYAWLLGSDIKGNILMPESKISESYEDQCGYFFSKYSKDLLVEGLIEILRQKFPDSDSEERHHAYLKPFRILVCLLDKPEIGPQVVGDLFLEVIRAFYSYCRDALGVDLKLSYTQSGSVLTSAIKENRNASEIVKTVNLLITSLSSDFLWDYMTRCFEDCLRSKSAGLSYPIAKNVSPPPTISELCTLLVFLLDVLPLELYSEVQTQYLPQMLSYMVQSLLEEMNTLSLPELTHALKTCFKVLSKVQMPPAYLDVESGSGNTSPSGDDGAETPPEMGPGLAEDDGTPFAPLKSEDSGIGLSASSPELSQHLTGPRVCPHRDDVWKEGGSMRRTLRAIQNLVADLAHKNLLGAPGPGDETPSAATPGQRGKKETPCAAPEDSAKKRSSWEAKAITVPQFKQMVSDWFAVRGSPFKPKSSEPAFPSGLRNDKGEEEDRWNVDPVAIDLGDGREDCREAFAAACHLLLDCTTFPVYLSEEQVEQLYLSLFRDPAGGHDSGFPLWLKSLMTVCCCVSDCYIQNVAISTLLEVINHSQSLALVIEDRVKRHKASGHNPFFGKLQMVTVPPVSPPVLKIIAEKTDFYQRVARVLWNQLNKETREHHGTCVELFYRLHCLAPSPNICEDIICHMLLEPDKGARLEALFRFSVIWHLTREIQGGRVTSHNRSFDRSLFVVLDSLNCSDGAIGAAAQGWLVRALSLNDVARILEPVLLLLLQPRTQRTSIGCIERQSSADPRLWFPERKGGRGEPPGASEPPEGGSEDELPSGRFTTVDREAIWAEVERDPEKFRARPEPADNPPGQADGPQDSSERTESADPSSGHTDSEGGSSSSMPSLDPPGPPGLARVDSDRTQASESLSSDEDPDLELRAEAASEPRRRRKEEQEATEAPFRHILLYLQPYDSRRVLYALSVLEAVLKTNPGEFVEAVARTSMDTSSTAHLNLIYNLLARHQEALAGQSFYGQLPAHSPTVCPHSLLIELLTDLCLSFLRSYYPRHLPVSHRDVLGNRDVQVKSVEVLIRLATQLVAVAKATEEKDAAFVRELLERCRLQELVLLSLSASMHASRRRGGPVAAAPDRPRGEPPSEEGLVNLGRDQIWSEHPLQLELLKLLQVLIVLEHHLGRPQEEPDSPQDLADQWRRALGFQRAIGALSYVRPQPVTSQGLFVSAVVRGLQPEYGPAMHPAWVGLVSDSLPYFGKSLGWTVAPFVVQICKNLDELVRQYESETAKPTGGVTSKKENIPPDYPLTLLEGLTTISHFCLLEQASPTLKPSIGSDPTNLRNARNAILEELPRIVNTMALLWSAVRKEDGQKRPADLLSATRASSSVYFKATKTIRQKILDFLNPLTAQLGVQLASAVAAVWSRKKARRQNKMKIIPEASGSQLTLVDLLCSLHTLKTDTILHLVKEVVKKPSQIKGEEKSSLVDIPMLQFSFAFIQRLPVSALQENFPPLLGVLKESVQLNLAPPGYFLLLSMLNDFVTRTPTLENKKDQKDLQEVTQKILEAVGNVAGSSLEQTSWLSRNLEVKAQPQITVDESDAEEDLGDVPTVPSSMVSASAPSAYSVQALSLLAEVLASLLDVVYRSDEKEKALPLISRLLYYVFPYLRNHSAYNIPSFRAGAQLLSSLSGYAYTKRTWKKEVLELYMDPAFFQMDTSCVHWKSIIDHLLTHEKTMFKDLMTMQSSSLKLFSSYEQKAMLLKRQAFAVFSGEIDQYHLYLPLIQERLTDNLRVGQTSLVAAQMFLFFRVLLLRISPQHLTSLWPIMVTELIQAFTQLEEDLTEEDDSAKSNGKVSRHKATGADGSGEIQQNELVLYVSACRFLDTALSFPPDKMPLFQMYRWAFVPEVDTETPPLPSDLMESHEECKPHIVRIVELLRRKYGDSNSVNQRMVKCEFPLLHQHPISSILQLIPFFRTLSWAFKTQNNHSQSPSESLFMDYPAGDGSRILKHLEESVEYDFLENLES
ncbi:protein dopey-2 isoform X2 [Ornithorhynchus anatinus]|uniref:protein dopey-2 isoform X2 n=1 Tax=Ornithorhynchus anatinus TaxID=9258 RepID=UPI0010A78C8B|nr:protein dopey-2 isoform X2 [Ornithorhynchus anatinus]